MKVENDKNGNVRNLDVVSLQFMVTGSALLL